MPSLMQADSNNDLTIMKWLLWGLTSSHMITISLNRSTEPRCTRHNAFPRLFKDNILKTFDKEQKEDILLLFANMQDVCPRMLRMSIHMACLQGILIGIE